MKRRIPLCLLLILVSGIAFSQVYKDPKQPVEKRVKSILSQMTLEEKIDYLGGVNSMFIRAVPRLGLPEIKMSDGPVGVRTFGNSTAYPAGVSCAATWNVKLEQQLGAALGEDCRSQGVHILLAPGVNICRAPMCGRNFEYLGEDPYLAGRMAVAYIKGVQSKGVSACVKHFAGNNQEWDRVYVSSDIDERTLQEIYLPAFCAAVKEAKVGCVMDSYNLLNGEHTTQNNHLNNDILKDKWGFKGLLMSDWGAATVDGLAAAKGGLDLEMPSGDHLNRQVLLSAIKSGELSESIINDKVCRILRLIFSFGFYDRPQQDASIPVDNQASDKVALQCAREGIVLLKNVNSLLPLDRNKIKSIAVLGPNASENVFGRGSSQTDPFHYVTVLDGIKAMAGDKVQVSYVSGMFGVNNLINSAVSYVGAGSKEKGLKGEYYNNATLSGEAVAVQIDEKIDFNWGEGAPNLKGVSFPNDNFSVRWTGVIRPEESGAYTCVVKGDDGFRLWIDGQKVIDLWQDQGTTRKTATIALEGGKEYSIKLEYYDHAGSAEIHFGWGNSERSQKDAVACASKSDVAVICVGFNGEESEGSDRSFELPLGQNELIQAVSKANPNTIVVVNAGGNVYMQPWLSGVKGLLQMWYGGQEGGTALSEILFGTVNPSGKLPDTFEKCWEDNPTFNSYYDSGKTMHVAYKEGLLVGYRYYDTKKVEPQFPFGYGLNYTTFTYAKMNVKKTGSHIVSGDVYVTNTGKRDGYEVVQIYVKPLAPSVTRPVHELKAFKKVFVKVGQTVQVDFTLDDSSFSYFDVQKSSWVVDHGQYEIQAGTNSRDILATAKVVY